MITYSLSRKVRLFFAALLILLPGGLYAASESYMQSLTGHLKKGDSVTVIDDKFLNLPLQQWNQLQHLSIDDIISFELRHDTVTNYYKKAFTCTLNVTIKYFTSRDQQTPSEIDSVNLVVKYDTVKGKPYAEVAHYRFKNAFKVTVVINSINSPEWKDKLPDCFRLRNQILVERKYPFDPHHNGKLHLGAYQPVDPSQMVAVAGPAAPQPVDPGVDLVVNNGQLSISWTAADFTGAEEFDLEWTFVDIQSPRGVTINTSYGQGPFEIPSGTEEQWMQHDATRVTVTTSPYTINLPYLDGYVLVRIRSASYKPITNVRVTGQWVYLLDDDVHTAAAYIPPRQTNLNWQYTGSFAEGGKRREVTSYADASMRTRQSVTVNNSDLTYKSDGSLTPTASVQEDIYDIMGRSTVNVMPAPTKSSLLDYIPNFNLNGSGAPYRYADITLASPGTSCSIAAAPMSTTSGASQYYSPANSFLDAQNLGQYYFNPYIPDAQQYPFAVTQLMPDNTGRVARQGGVGPVLQTGGANDTKFFYGKPTETELLRMFGQEVGDASHYIKNMVIDPNGQASVSFIDARGKTIATALAGGAPPTLDALSTNNPGTAITPLNDVLIEPTDFAVDAGSLNMSATSTFLAETTGAFTLNYTVNPLALTTSYAGGANTLCNNCYYTVAVQIMDPCGNVVANTTSTPFTIDDFTCHVNPTPVSQGVGFTVNQLGTYRVSYSLQLSEQVIEDQTNYYIQTNTDLETLQYFFFQELKSLDLSGCYSSCTACKALQDSVGFVDSVLNLLSTPYFAGITVGSSSSDPILHWIDTTYSSLKRKCNALSCSVASPCDQKLTQLEQDVLPGGQYALYDVTALENNATTVFLEPATNVMEFYNQDPAISSLTFIAANGTSQQVGSLDQADFVRAYLQHPEWASLFVVHHIEYCSYLWCKDASNPVPASDNEVSYTFDANLQQNYTAGSDAENAGYYNHADPLALLKLDPWFNGSGRGVTYYSQMQSDLLNLTTVLSATPLDNTVSPAVPLPVKNIIQYIDWLLYCKPTDFNSTAAELTSSWNNCSPNATCRSATMEWQQYLNDYMQLKAKYYKVAKLAYFAADPASAPNQGCLDCFIGNDPLAAAGCVPPGGLSDYSVVLRIEGNSYNYYIVYNNGNSPFPGSYAFTFEQISGNPDAPGSVVAGPTTVTANQGAYSVLISANPVQPGDVFVLNGYFQITNIYCTPSTIIAACNASLPTTPAYTCPPASSFTFSNNKTTAPSIKNDNCRIWNYTEFLNYSGPALPVAVTVPVGRIISTTDPATGQSTSNSSTIQVTFQPGQTQAEVAPVTDMIGDPQAQESQQCPSLTTNFSAFSTPVCAAPPVLPPSSMCTSNTLYQEYAGKTRVFNDYTNLQGYLSCDAAGIAQSALATAEGGGAYMVQVADQNLANLAANWLSMLQNVRNTVPAFSGITDATLQTLVGNLYNISATYLTVAALGPTAMNVVSTLPGTLPSGVTAPAFTSFSAAFNNYIGSTLVGQGFSADLIGNVYPYNKVPYAVDPNVATLTPDIYSNISSNVTAFQNAWNASGVSTFSGYLQQQLGDDWLMTSAQLSDLQTKIAGGCPNPYLSNPAILPVSFVVANPASVSNPLDPASPPVASITCSQMATLVANFQSTYPGVPTNSTDPVMIQLYQTLFTNYANHQLGYPLSWADYQGFLTICSTHSTALLYDKPQDPGVVNDLFSCAAQAFSNIYSKAGQEYTLYINQIRLQFRNAYVSKCLSNQASANIMGSQYQYHYTLYYYDQAGNLEKTVPPEGVHLLSDQDLTTIETIPTQTATGCAAYPSTVLSNQTAILSDLSSDLQNDAQAMELWLFNNSGATTRSVRMVTPDSRYLCQVAIANGYVFYEQYALTPDASGNGIDMNLTNAAVATLLPQEVLQNWTHVVVQSLGGLNNGTLTLYVDGNKLTNIPLISAPPYPYSNEIDGATGGYALAESDVTQLQQLRLYQNAVRDGDVLLDYQNSCLAPAGALVNAWELWGLFNQPNYCDNITATSTLLTVADRGALWINNNPDPTSTLGTYALTKVTNTFTVEFWVNPQVPDNVPIPGFNNPLAGVIYHPPYAIFPLYGGAAATGHANMGVAVGTNGITVFEHAANYLPAVLDWRGTVNGWTHVAVVYNNLIPSLYVNGQLVATGQKSRKTTVSPSYNFGGGIYGYMNGGIDEVRIWSVARTPAQILANYTQELALTDNAGLMGYWPMDATHGNILHDVSCNGNDAPFLSPADSWSTSAAPITDNTYVPFANRLIVPNHGLPTNYAYNSFNSAVSQVTPDGGLSTYLYDRLGRIVISQSAEQNQPAAADNYNVAGRFSYSRYDVLGRIVEVGEKLGAITLAETDTRVDQTLQSWYSSGSNRQVTITAYDAAPTWAPANLPENNLRKRVAATALLSSGSDPTQNRQSATYYSYDYDGNVAELTQENAALISNEQQVVTGSAGLKDIQYQYDLISNKVNKVLYEDGKWDQFYYQYIYDADNRLINAYSSRENSGSLSQWNNEATYRYYLHGPLGRMELGVNATGSQGVQGLDYAYTLQGWLKGLNGQQITPNGSTQTDMGGDGIAGSSFSTFAQDAAGYSLGYFNGDYQPIGSSAGYLGTAYQSSASGAGSGVNLYNGNIGYSTYALTPFVAAGATSGFSGYTYRYDQLNRLTAMDHHVVGTYTGTAGWNSGNISGDYGEQASYDGDGNILTYKRYGTLAGGLMDNLSYNYSRDGNGLLLNNKLGYINDAASDGAYTTDLKNQPAGNYTYDANGNLIADQTQNLGRIYWTAYGKMAQIYQGAVPAPGITFGQGPGLVYGYDPGGNRIAKVYTAANGSGTTTYYVRDAQGNVLAVYQYKTNSSGGVTEGDWTEQHLYGSSRLGMLQPHVSITPSQALANDAYNSTMDAGIESSGNRLYELSNHLGNVMATVTDVINPPGSNGNAGSANTATIQAAQDYYPFGMQMPGRTYIASWSSLNYRYGFNGKENDNEVEGVGNSIDYGMRVYDPRAGRFMSTDPLQKKYPWLSPYQFAENDVIRSTDLDGLEKQIAIDGSVVWGPVNIDAVNASILSNHTKAQQAAMKQAAGEKYIQDYYRTHPQQGLYQSSSGSVESQGTALFRQYLNDPDNIGGQAAYTIANNLHDARTSFKEGDWGHGSYYLTLAGINTVTLVGAGEALEANPKIEVKTGGPSINVKTRLPVSNGSWSGEPGNSLWNSTLPEVNKITGNAGVPFKNGRIDLSEWSRVEFTIDGMAGTDNDFTLVYKKMVKDWGFATQKAAQDWLKANGLTPHHEGKNTIQLVPTVLNNIPHVGSASDLRNQ